MAATIDLELAPSQGDVTVEPIDPLLCEMCGEPATHRVMIELRAVGMGLPVMEGCAPCAARTQVRLRAALPKDH